MCLAEKSIRLPGLTGAKWCRCGSFRGVHDPDQVADRQPGLFEFDTRGSKEALLTQLVPGDAWSSSRTSFEPGRSESAVRWSLVSLDREVSLARAFAAAAQRHPQHLLAY